MKSMAIVAATAASLAMTMSGVLAQDVCLKPFNQCMETCSTKPGKDSPDQCFGACQRKNDQCSEKVFGARRESDPASRSIVAKPDAKKAMAKQVAPPPRKVDIAPRISETPRPRDVEIAPRTSETPAPREVDIPARSAAAPDKPATETK